MLGLQLNVQWGNLQGDEVQYILPAYIFHNNIKCIFHLNITVKTHGEKISFYSAIHSKCRGSTIWHHCICVVRLGQTLNMKIFQSRHIFSNLKYHALNIFKTLPTYGNLSHINSELVPSFPCL